MEIKTYPDMNEKIKGLLRFSNEPIMLYAADRIEELEHERDAAVEGLTGNCLYCIKRNFCTNRKGPHKNCWEWRGTKSKGAQP